MLFTDKSPTHGVCTHEAGKDQPRTKSPTHGVCTHEAGKDQPRTKPNATTSVILIHFIKHHHASNCVDTSSLFRVKAESPEMYSGASCTSFIAAAFFCNFRYWRTSSRSPLELLYNASRISLASA